MWKAVRFHQHGGPKAWRVERVPPLVPSKGEVDAYGRVWKGHVTNMGAGAGSIFSLLPPENATGNHFKVVQRIPIRIDFDRSSQQDFNVEGVLEPGLSVEPEVRVR